MSPPLSDLPKQSHKLPPCSLSSRRVFCERFVSSRSGNKNFIQFYFIQQRQILQPHLTYSVSNDKHVTYDSQNCCSDREKDERVFFFSQLPDSEYVFHVWLTSAARDCALRIHFFSFVLRFVFMDFVVCGIECADNNDSDHVRNFLARVLQWVVVCSVGNNY